MKRSGLLVLMLAAACREDVPASHERPRVLDNAPAPGTSEADRPHVVFTRASMTIERLGVPVVPPVTTPSTPSQETMRSDDPTVVAVERSGALVGMRPGTTTVRAAASGSSLEVTVLDTGRLRLEPSALELRPGAEAEVRVLGGDGQVIPAEAVRWRIPAGAPVGVVRGRVMSLGAAGRFELVATVGDAAARLPVAVRLAGAERLVVSPARARARAGEVVKLQLFGGTAELQAAWTSSEPSVLAPLGGGLFEARRAGKVEVCAAALDRSSCSEVEVEP